VKRPKQPELRRPLLLVVGKLVVFGVRRSLPLRMRETSSTGKEISSDFNGSMFVV
jgi:hypothetical protein